MAKKNPCEFCEEEVWESQVGSAGHQLYHEIYPDANCIAVTSYANDEAGESEELQIQFPMNYCPNCGRKLC